jgi:hypothetical protein
VKYISNAVRYTIYPVTVVVWQAVTCCCNVKPDAVHGLASGKSRTVVVHNKQIWYILSDEEKSISYLHGEIWVLLILFICGLFNKALRTSGYKLALNSIMINDLWTNYVAGNDRPKSRYIFESLNNRKFTFIFDWL